MKLPTYLYYSNIDWNEVIDIYLFRTQDGGEGRRVISGDGNFGNIWRNVYTLNVYLRVIMSTLTEDPVFKEILDKLTGIEKSVGRIDSRLDILDSLVKEHNDKLTTFETSLQFKSETSEEHRKEIDAIKTSLKTQQQSIDLLKKNWMTQTMPEIKRNQEGANRTNISARHFL